MASSNPSGLPRSPGNSSFPVPPTTSGSHQAPSIISSRMTDIASEDGDEYQPDNSAAPGRPATGTSAGRTTLDPNRPSTGKSSQTRFSNRAPSARLGIPFGGAQRETRQHAVNLNPSRPQSASSRASRTHVPSLASHAFFRPMSSQRLQAQRAGRMAATSQSAASDGEAGSVTNRNSVISNGTDQGPYIHQDADMAPPSRGTDYSDRYDRITNNASPTRDATIGSVGDDERPLQNISANLRPAQLDMGKNQRPTNGRPSPIPKSPRLFKGSFLLPGKEGYSDRETSGHERLSSDGTSQIAQPQSAADPKQKPGKNYQYFSGNTAFCWGGRLQNTRDRPVNVASGIIVVLPSILFLVYSGPYLSHHVSPAIPVFFAYIAFICISSFIHASVTDPGIFPRNLHPFPPPDSDDPLTLGPPLTEWVSINSISRSTTAIDVRVKYCKTCNIWRPPRCHHCRICDNCIETQDHHCVWINNCVGRRNYRYFFSFISTGTILGIFLTFASLGHCLRYQSEKDISFREAIDHLRVPFAMFIYGLLATPYPSCLWGYHLFLMGMGETTREYLYSQNFLKKDRHRPFTQRNILKNWAAVLLRPRPPTYMHFKKEYEEGDQRFGPRRGQRTAPLADEQKGGGIEMQGMAQAKASFLGPWSARRRDDPRAD